MPRGREQASRRVRDFFREVLDEMARNEEFASRVSDALDAHPTGPGDQRPRASVRPHRRRPGPIDPFAVYEGDKSRLRAALSELDLEQLKDIVAEHKMDPAKLAMKWKAPERLVDLIVDTVAIRATKGDVFRVTSDRDAPNF